MAVSEGQSLRLSIANQSTFSEMVQDVNTLPGGVVQVNDGLQILQQQPQGTVVRWERFLPVRSLKVLLVENDDSTRHVICALLRNCSYEVVAVGNGLQAWKILEDTTNHIDLVLTEVVMPLLSGIGLLCKIMSHRTNIPVIMMSSHDSMITIFECFSKGAVDFLVKPIRKNELKNLWQHIWRRFHGSSGSGSGSESGIQTKAYVKSKSNGESDNDIGNTDENDDWSNDPSIRGGSDEGSGTQSSWRKMAAEEYIPQLTSPLAHSVDAPDSTCALAIHTKPENHSSMWVHVTKLKECQGENGQLEVDGLGKDLGIGISRNPDLHCGFQEDKSSVPFKSPRQNKFVERDHKLSNNKQLQNGKNLTVSNQAPNIACAMTNCNNPQAESRSFDSTSHQFGKTQIKESFDSGGTPHELNLNWLIGVGDAANIAKEDKNILRHSHMSAFSRYNSASSANQASKNNARRCSSLDNNPVAPNTVSTSYPSLSNGTRNPRLNENGYNNQMTSATNYVFTKSEALDSKPESISAYKSLCSPPFNFEQVVPLKGDDTSLKMAQVSLRGSQEQVQVQHQHPHCHYHHHVHKMQQDYPQIENNDLSLNNMETTSQQCGSSNVFSNHAESIAANHSFYGSVTGSNHVSNGQNGSSEAVNAGGANVESDNGVGWNSGAAGISGINSSGGEDKERAAQREAALTKFRQKRKDRCFEKRVRYHSRKKLAEQRPRIRGQFVRQIEPNTKQEIDCQSKNLTSGDDSCDGLQ